MLDQRLRPYIMEVNYFPYSYTLEHFVADAVKVYQVGSCSAFDLYVWISLLECLH